MPHLFSALRLRDVTLANRIGVSPMCQYSCDDGYANDWHFAHLAARAVGGAALVFTEAAAVSPEGRISPQDLGAWSDKHFEPLERIARFIDGARRGRRHSARPRRPQGEHLPAVVGRRRRARSGGRLAPVAPSAIAFGERYATPEELSVAAIAALQQAFATAASAPTPPASASIEIHAAHGYLAHEFLSPLSNRRADAYGGSFDNRVRFLCECAAAVRRALPDACPLFVRISATDWTEGGWDVEQSVELARRLKGLGVDVIDCSSGGNVEKAQGSGRTRLSGPVRRADPARGGYRHRGRRHDHRAGPGRCRSSAPARPISRCWRANCCASPIGRCAPPASSATPCAWPAQYLRAGPTGAPERMPAHEID